jgi:uncharacterized protein YdiU (UPF0061 family)
MEAFNPAYCPWEGGGVEYCFARQPQALATNCVGLAQAFTSLLEDVCASEGMAGAERAEAVEQIRRAVSEGYVKTFEAAHDENCRRKLGLVQWDGEAEALWVELTRLMSSQSGGGVDFTLLFRGLGALAPEAAEAATASVAGGEGGEGGAGLGGGLVRRLLAPAALDPVASWPEEHREGWAAWTQRYVVESLPTDD